MNENVCMDPEISIMFSVPCFRIINESNTNVNISDTFNRRPCTVHDTDINSIWYKRVQENQKLFNGTKFRLDSVELNDSSVILNLGLTCYRDFLGTNWSPNVLGIQEYGRKEYSNPQACLSDAMGVGAFVETTDKCVIFMQRSMYCAEAGGLWDIPGGHAEPQEIVGKLPYEDIDIHSMAQKEVVLEIYNSIIREVVDEVNLPESSLSRPIMLGAARNLTAAGRASVEFLIKCCLSSDEVLKLYNKGNQDEAYETTTIKMIPIKEIVTMETDHDLWRHMAPSAKGCITLYKLHNKQNV